MPTEAQLLTILIADYQRTFAPTSSHEQFLVEEMAQARWRLARTRRLEGALIQQMLKAAGSQDADTVLAAALFDKTAGPFNTLQRYAAAAERSYYRALKQLQAGREQELQNEPNSATKSPRPALVRTQSPPACPAPARQFAESGRGRTENASRAPAAALRRSE